MHRVLGFCLLAAVLLTGIPAAADIYRYTDDSGVVRFTTDPKSIPEHLLPGAVHIPADEAESPPAPPRSTTLPMTIRRDSAPATRPRTPSSRSLEECRMPLRKVVLC